MQNFKIPICRPVQIGNECKYVMDAMTSNWISSQGSYIEKFENEFSKQLNVLHTVSCSNGTTALHLALLALGITTGDEVICPNSSMIATSNAVLYCGGLPVFVDTDIETFNMDITKIESLITPKTKAIIVMHTLGNPVNMDKIIKLVKKHQLFLVEDAAQAHGAKYKGQYVGTFGDIGCFSFYANKIITGGEGGACVTNSKTIYNLLNQYKNHFFGVPRFVHDGIGYNYRMTNLQAAILCAQLENWNYFTTTRVVNRNIYKVKLRDIFGITFQKDTPDGFNVCWMTGIIINKQIFGLNAEQLQIELAKYGIDTRRFFYPNNLQPCYSNIKMPQNVSYQNSKYLWDNVLYLPSSTNLSFEEIMYITDKISKIYNIKNKNIQNDT